jgi:hypothetical protein
MFAFTCAGDDAEMLLTGQSSQGVQSVWQAGFQMLASFGGRRHSGLTDSPVAKINSDGSLAMVFQPGGRSMFAMPRQTLYER